MKLTFCPVDLPDGQEIETIKFETPRDAYQAAYEKMLNESKANNGYTAVIWLEQGKIGFGEHFSICFQPHLIASAIFDLIDTIYHPKVTNINIFCFATFEEAFEYAKDYCHGVWPGVDDLLN